jgi:hypothetical protein
VTAVALAFLRVTLPMLAVVAVALIVAASPA